jgi:hypothetical protein
MANNIIIVLGLSFIVWLWYSNRNPAVMANNTVPYWYTGAGDTMKQFDYASQNNYALESVYHHAY